MIKIQSLCPIFSYEVISKHSTFFYSKNLKKIFFLKAAKQLIDEANKKSLDSTATDVQKAEAGIEIEVANEVLKAAAGGGGGH